MNRIFVPSACCIALLGALLGVGFFVDDKVPWTRAQLLAQFDFTRHLFAEHEPEDIMLDCDNDVVSFTYPDAQYEELVRYFDNGSWKKMTGGGSAVYRQEGCMVVLDRGTMLIKGSSVGLKRTESPQK